MPPLNIQLQKLDVASKTESKKIQELSKLRIFS